METRGSPAYNAEMQKNFVHLHTHSHYSLLSGLPQIPDLVGRAKEFNMESLALTDAGALYGAIEFYKKCGDARIKPIIGLDAYVASRTRLDKEPGADTRRTRLVLIAESITGYRNLIKIVSSSFLDGFYYKPRIDLDLLKSFGEGLIAIIPASASEVSEAIRAGSQERAISELEKIRSLIGVQNVYQEIVRAGPSLPYESKLLAFAKSAHLPIVATNDVYYLNPEDKRVRDMLLAIQSNSDAVERSDWSLAGTDFSFTSQDEMWGRFHDLPQALQATVEIASRIDLVLPLGKWVFPDYCVPQGLSHEEELKRLVYSGIQRRGLTETAEIKKRIEHELSVILEKGYAPYFLVVYDLLRFAHEAGILTTIRGSVAGSIVTYLAGITDVNPIEYRLPFERFLTRERPTPPDIDMDFADDRRDEVIEYAKKKYGYDKVAQIGTFGTMMARGSVRDVARALGHPYAVGDEIARMIPMGSQGFPMTIERAIEIVPELSLKVRSDPVTREIVEISKRIEGCARHISVHAAGVVISPTTLTNFVPLQYDTKGEKKIITQYDMYSVEDAGLLKFDFLGIRNLSTLSNSVKLVLETYGSVVDLDRIPLDDPRTFSLLSRGETVGLFQLNGSGMTNYLKQLRPTSIHDINAMVALYRPGPMESIPQYIERKHAPHLVSYLDPRMKEILDQSHGVITYQDDVLLISIKLAGFSWVEADKLRYAMGKKIPVEMERQREKLMKGLETNGMTSERAERLWKLIEPFAAYGFNKAHAACYGRVAYQTAYMKANYPAVYMASVLTAESGNIDEVGDLISECKRMGIPVLPPSINESSGGFTVVKEGKNPIERIRFGLYSVKNFGEGIADEILKERDTRGKYSSLSNFLERIHHRNLNKKSLESLIKCGAMDEFGERGAMLASLDDLLEYNRESGRTDSAQSSLFSLLPERKGVAETLRLRSVSPASLSDRLAWERELLGLYISGHPLDKFREKLAKHETTIRRLKDEYQEGMIAVVPGIVEESRELLTRGGERMMFLRIADFTGSIETVVFPRVCNEYRAILRMDNCIAVKGRVSDRNGSRSIIAETIKEL